MTKVCRLCLIKLQRGSKYFNINAVESFTGFMPYRDQLTTCIPEMALDLIPNPVICNNCRTALKSSYVFKSRCLLVEKKIRQYVENKPGYVYNLSEIDTSTLPKPAKYESEILRESAQKKPIPILPKVENQSQPLSLLSNLLTAKSDIILPNTSEIEITNVSVKPESFKGNYEETEPTTTDIQMKQIEDDEQDLSCGKCDRKFCSLPVLHSHKARVHEEDYICNFCSVSFKTLQNLRRHNQQCQKLRTVGSTNTVLTKRPHLPTKAKNHLKRWLFKHTDHPYPTDFEKQQLMKETNLSLLQVENWFINARRRILADLTKLKNLGQPTRGRRKKFQHSQLEYDYEDLIESGESEKLFEDILVKRESEIFEAIDDPLEISVDNQANGENSGIDNKTDGVNDEPVNTFMEDVENSEEDPLEDVPLSNIAKEIKLEIQVEER